MPKKPMANRKDQRASVSSSNRRNPSAARYNWLHLPVTKLLEQRVSSKVFRLLKAYAHLMRLEKPIGTLLLLWPTLWALFLANQGAPSLHHLFVFTLGTFLMRSAGCVINDFADRSIDGSVSRTKLRPFARGDVTEFDAIVLFLALGALSFILVLTLDLNTILLSVVAIVIAFIYPFMKRYTYFPQLILGAAFAWSIPMAYSSSGKGLAIETWVMYISTLLWVLAYDTFYAMVDRKDDMKIGVKSTAILFGDADLPLLGIIQSMFLLGMLMVGIRLELLWPYYLSLFGASLLIGYQFWITRKRKPDQCFKAFLNNNYVGLVIFIGIIGHYIVR